eukprot:gene27613-34359_t
MNITPSVNAQTPAGNLIGVDVAGPVESVDPILPVPAKLLVSKDTSSSSSSSKPVSSGSSAHDSQVSPDHRSDVYRI